MTTFSTSLAQGVQMCRSAFMLIGSKYKVTVGEVEQKYTDEVGFPLSPVQALAYSTFPLGILTH